MKGKKLTPAGLKAECLELKAELKDAKRALAKGFRLVKKAKAKAARLHERARTSLLHHGETEFFEWEGGERTRRRVDWLTELERVQGSYGMCYVAGIPSP